MNSFSGIILAGGAGNRFGCKKQFCKINGVPVYKIVENIARECLDDVIVVGVDIEPGETRQESVRRGLIIAKGKYCLIFDAVRPLVSKEQIEILKDKVVNHPSVSLARKSVNTIYDTESQKYLRKTIYELLVPQAFETKFLKEAHCRTTINDATDDTILMKNVFGLEPLLVETGNNLFKITYPGDIEIIRAIKKFQDRKK